MLRRDQPSVAKPCISSVKAFLVLDLIPERRSRRPCVLPTNYEGNDAGFGRNHLQQCGSCQRPETWLLRSKLTTASTRRQAHGGRRRVRGGAAPAAGYAER